METKHHELVFAADRMLERIDRDLSDIAERVERTLKYSAPSMKGSDWEWVELDDGRFKMVQTFPKRYCRGVCECRGDMSEDRTDFVIRLVESEFTTENEVIYAHFTAYREDVENWKDRHSQLGNDYPRDLLPIYTDKPYNELHWEE
jgi:hypothetical protein